ncbi:MAG: hypothetical protein ACPGUC_03255, partial [Gammaproteobacteria bacterium]
MLRNKSPRTTTILTLAALTLLSGCATQPSELKSAEVSTSGYEGMSCSELAGEARGNLTRTDELFALLEKKAKDDEAQTAIGVILFWPALFALEGGDGPEAAEYSRLKGELNAMEKVIYTKDCTDARAMIDEHREKVAQARAMTKKNQEAENTSFH